MNHPSGPATPRQRQLLDRLVNEPGVDDALHGSVVGAYTDGRMTKALASDFIDQLLAAKRHRPVFRTNRYAGTCADCDQHVSAREGRIFKGPLGKGKWQVAHHQGACPQPEPAPAPVAARPPTFEERLERQRQNGNWFLAGKLACVERASSLEEAYQLIGDSCQGMTMDYMHDFFLERTAADLAREAAHARFTSHEVPAPSCALKHPHEGDCVWFAGKQCPTCGFELTYRADYGAPGVGQAWECVNGHEYAKVGGDFYPPEAQTHVLTAGEAR